MFNAHEFAARLSTREDRWSSKTSSLSGTVLQNQVMAIRRHDVLIELDQDGKDYCWVRQDA